jgi:hypothetical protein
MRLRICGINRKRLMQLIARVRGPIHFDQQLSHLNVSRRVVRIRYGSAQFAQRVVGTALAAINFCEAAMRGGVIGSGKQRFGESALGVIEVAGFQKLLTAIEMQSNGFLRAAR